jgi:uracil-DNA glycosylase family 4
MGDESSVDWHRGLASALEWWSDAGVETLQEDAPRDWLARAAPVREMAAPEAESTPAFAEVLPGTLESFLEWRMGVSAPEADWMTPMIAPSGPADAALVVVTDMPESDDTDALTGGQAGRLLDRMLAAIGLARESVYLMPLAWARPLTGQIPGDQEARLTELARHHLKLLAPARLLLLGSAHCVLGKGSATGQSLEDINHFAGQTRVVASYSPRFLLGKPAAKSEAWKHLLWLTRGSQ